MDAVERVPKDITLIVLTYRSSNIDNLLILARSNPDNLYQIGSHHRETYLFTDELGSRLGLI